MSVSIQFKPTISTASNKWKIWRIINSTTILFAFFIPWAVVARDPYDHAELIFTGFQVLQFYKDFTLSVLSLYGFIPWVSYLLFYNMLGFITMLVYCALNIFVAAFTTKFIDKPIWNISTFCLISLWWVSLLHIDALYFHGWQNLSDALWGWWLVWIGLVSSTVLEIIYFFSKSIYKPKFFRLLILCLG